MMHIRACVDIPRQSFVVNPQIVVMVRSIEMLIFVIVYCALTTLKVIPVQGVAAISYAAIVEPPANQYILEDEVATLTCSVQGAHLTYWFINGNATNHHQHQSYYEGLGVTFNESSSSNITNLTMTVPACIASKVSNIQCVAKDGRFRAEWSDAVWINVFKSFRPYPPIITVDAVYYPMSLPQLYVIVKGEPLWPDYEISEFRMNITNTTSGCLLEQVIATNDTFENNTVRVQVSDSLLMLTTEEYYSLTISVSVVSPLYNEGKPNQTIISVLRSKCTKSKVQDGDASLYKVVTGISFGIALVLLLAFTVLLVCFCVHYQRTRQQGNSSQHQAHSIQRCMVTNPTYDCGQVYDTIDHQDRSVSGASCAKTTSSRYSNSPNHNVNTSSLDKVPHIQQMCYTATCVDTPSVSNTDIKKCKKDRNKLRLSLPRAPSSLGCDDRGQNDVCGSGEGGCEKSEEGLYVEMRQTGHGALSQHVIQHYQC